MSGSAVSPSTSPFFCDHCYNLLYGSTEADDLLMTGTISVDIGRKRSSIIELNTERKITPLPPTSPYLTSQEERH